jgi:hypothetical protein
MPPPHNGPISPPASEAAAIAPSPSARRPGATRAATIAIATGTTAPPPVACTPRAIATIVSPCDSATQADPAQNSSNAAAKTRPWPYVSATRPISGIATT